MARFRTPIFDALGRVDLTRAQRSGLGAHGRDLSVVWPGRRDQGQESIFGYGTGAGVWRILRALDETALPATIFFGGLLAPRRDRLWVAIRAEVARAFRAHVPPLMEGRGNS